MEDGIMNEKSQVQSESFVKKDFICGVIEGFYGRPWTTVQRQDLFRKLKKWGMESYVYAPKDDYKHRAFWRELYTVEEADHLSSLIASAKEHNVKFYYALSPGLDMTYSSQKEIQTLKRKLDQVSQFGCEAFALLFDDIESELSKADKEVFQTFANAQVSVTNEIHSHLGNPKFLFCPTQYCSSRAVPTVHDSEYLNTLGSKLNHSIDIMWTGNKVISKIITLESIQEITEVLRRPPVIWDNLHANDYDQKRVFLGPYSGRSPELIPHLRGVMTNPNCEFHANTIAIHTLAYWSQCSMDSQRVSSSLSADIKLETENEEDSCPDECSMLKKNVYHPRIALKNAIAEWLPEFFVKKEAWGPITKPQPQVTNLVMPIIPSINTCMSLTTTTNTSTTVKSGTLPEVNTTQLQALADVCSTVNASSMNPISTPVMNSLVLPTKVVTNEDILNPITTAAASNIEFPKKIPVSIVSVPIMHSSAIAAETDESECESNDAENGRDHPHTEKSINSPIKSDKSIEGDKLEAEIMCKEEQATIETEDIAVVEKTEVRNEHEPIPTNVQMLDDQNLSPLSANEPMECSSSLTSLASQKEDRKTNTNEDVVMAETDTELSCVNECNNSMSMEHSPAIADEEDKLLKGDDKSEITVDDLFLLCDLFYLPFEHGSRSFKLLNEFNWLKANSHVLLAGEPQKCVTESKPEVTEWMQRADYFGELCQSVHDLLKKVAQCANKEICHDLFSYVWDIAGALTLLNAFVKWLSLAHFPPNVYTYTQGSYTWFSKGWKQAFMSGDQEPWVFRGGLTADLQRLMPVDAGNDLFLYKLPELPTINYHTLRPYKPNDEGAVYQVCTRSFVQLVEANVDTISLPLPDKVRDLIPDCTIGPFVTLTPELCIVAVDATHNSIVGYAAAAIDVNVFTRNFHMCWLPAMKEKYATERDLKLTESEKINETLSSMLKSFEDDSTMEYQCPIEVSSSYPAVMTVAVLANSLDCDHGIVKRLVTVALAALRSKGCFGVHVRLNRNDTDQAQFYTKIGFAEVYRECTDRFTYLGRRF